MVGSAAMKQGRSANRKHTYFFGLTLPSDNNSDREGRTFLSHPYTNDGCLFSFTILFLIFISKKPLDVQGPELQCLLKVSKT